VSDEEHEETLTRSWPWVIGPRQVSPWKGLSESLAALTGKAGE